MTIISNSNIFNDDFYSGWQNASYMTENTSWHFPDFNSMFVFNYQTSCPSNNYIPAYVPYNSANYSLNTPKTTAPEESYTGNGDAKSLYDYLGLQNEGLSYEAFSLAIQGYNNLKDKGNGRLGIVDPKSKKYYLIDMNKFKVIGQTEVKFGSGNMNAVANANKSGSHATLSGFTKVAEEYNGKWAGGAKRMDGLEKNINNNARSKAVVIHSTTKNSTWGCIGFTPVYKNGQVNAKATNEKLKNLFPKDTIIFTCPSNVSEYKQLSSLV